MTVITLVINALQSFIDALNRNIIRMQPIINGWSGKGWIFGAGNFTDEQPAFIHILHMGSISTVAGGLMIYYHNLSVTGVMKLSLLVWCSQYHFFLFFRWTWYMFVHVYDEIGSISLYHIILFKLACSVINQIRGIFRNTVDRCICLINYSLLKFIIVHHFVCETAWKFHCNRWQCVLLQTSFNLSFF